MAATDLDLRTEIVDLAEQAFEAFCEDIAGMFDIEMSCEQKETSDMTVAGLKKHFKKLVAVNTVKAEGAVAGDFMLIFDQEGLFTLGGTIVMLPEQRIIQNRKRGSEADAKDMSDAVGECGNLLVGSWDRIFREGLEGHGHFVQTDVFIGKPWVNPEKSIGLEKNQEIIFSLYEMTIEPHGVFKCGVIFPQATLEAEAEEAAAENANAEVNTGENAAQTQPSDPAKTETDVKGSATEEPQTDESSQQDTTINEKASGAESDAEDGAVSESAEVTEAVAVEVEAEKTEEASDSESTAVEPKPQTEQPKTDQKQENVDKAESPDAEIVPESKDDQDSDSAKPVEAKAKQEGVDGDTTVAAETETGQISESIKKMAQSASNLQKQSNQTVLDLKIQDIMHPDVAWLSGDDTVERATATMQQSNCGYLMIGAGGKLEGILSRTDLLTAISIYLKPMFSKWRTPADDATLQIKLKWVMSRTINTIGPDITVVAAMQNMCQSGSRCLPVVGTDGSVVGIVTVFDIFKAVINNGSDANIIGNSSQMPPLF